jgi:beta-phosphoglucomutase family hydrolase
MPGIAEPATLDPRSRRIISTMSTARPGGTPATSHRQPDTADSATVEWSEFHAVLFDLDGVITPTAAVHEKAWAELFASWDYTTQDYLTYIDGRPRYDGVRSFLGSRGIELDEGSPDDPPGEETVCALGNKKNQLFNTVVERDGVRPYPGSVALLDLLDRLGIAQAIVSSSKNARSVLTAAGMGHRFAHVVDGVVAAELGLAGKPAPDMFLRAAELLSVDPSRAVVVEDATSGVAAGVAGEFGLVLGVDRGGNRQALLDHGASLVVDDLGQTIDRGEA